MGVSTKVDRVVVVVALPFFSSFHSSFYLSYFLSLFLSFFLSFSPCLRSFVLSFFLTIAERVYIRKLPSTCTEESRTNTQNNKSIQSLAFSVPRAATMREKGRGGTELDTHRMAMCGRILRQLAPTASLA